ncbi:MAG: alcohol dehydrogenase [Deltaproteobacteria bacterium]|jgi:threonine dehydrogenase-like Zn-dependent dehydrogenase|nr:alcohol dehydrogenase [Deltaproteobacteria bacterium]
MKQVRIHGPDDVRLDEIPEPEPGPDDAILAVAACGICGSDVGYAKLGGVQGPAPEPVPLGHELAGTVVAVGDRVRGIEIGSRVALNPGAAGFGLGSGGPEGGFTPRLLVRGAGLGKSLFPIPDDMPFEIAALAEPLGVGMNAVDQVDVQPGEKVAVLGAGPIGLSAIATLHDRGVEDIVAIDLSETRLEIARKLGAKDTINPKNDDLWNDLGRLHGTEQLYWMDLVDTDVFIEATGSGALLKKAIERGGNGSRISVVALHRQEVPVDFMTVLMKQMRLQGAIEYPERFENMLELLARRDLGPMITHRFRLDEFSTAFEVAKSPDAGAKIMIEIG